MTMMDFQIKRTSRRCRVSGRELLPGEDYVSELVSNPSDPGGDFERHDYSMDEWKGPCAGSIGWWRCRIPVMNTGKVYWAPVDVHREYFSHLLAAEPRNDAKAFVMAMLMVRRRMLKLEQEVTDDEGNPWLVVIDPDKQEIRVRVVQLSLEERLVIQQEFADQLFTDQPSG
jgi:hypothetical protein